MTIREKLLNWLIAQGMNHVDADRALTDVENNPMFVLTAVGGTWRDDVTAYPEQFSTIIRICLKNEAHQWIRKHMPQQWYSPRFMLTPEEQQWMTENNASQYITTQ